MRVLALIVAAGRGVRAAGGARDGLAKQYRPLGGVAMIVHSTRAFVEANAVTDVICVIHPDHGADFINAFAAAGEEPPAHVTGGATRQASVLNGLRATRDGDYDAVLVHDAARPFVSDDVIARVVSALDEHEAALPALPVADTLKRGRAGSHVVETVARDDLFAAQTPQGFRYRALLDAHEAALASGIDDFTDDASIAEWRGITVKLVPGDARNSKVTSVEDFTMADQLLSMHGSAYETRMGTGYDVHRLGPGSHIMLCGLKLPHDKTLVGHSDADVGAHALTDALLGAIGDGDIGMHFPPSDPKWKGASSDQFLADAGRRVRARSGSIVHVDVTLICEQPKIGPHREAMRVRLAEILSIQADRVSVKATTSEGLGFTGRSEGIAAMASATIRLPQSD